VLPVKNRASKSGSPCVDICARFVGFKRKSYGLIPLIYLIVVSVHLLRNLIITFSTAFDLWHAPEINVVKYF